MMNFRFGNPEKFSSADIGKITSFKKGEKEGDKQLDKTDERIENLDQAFDNLIDVVKDAPEARQEALNVLINDIRQQAEHISQVRDLRNFNELKREMVKQWKELEKVAGNDPAILGEIKKWGQSFMEERLLYHDLIGDVKDELADKAVDVSSVATEVKSIFGEISGLCKAAGVRFWSNDELDDIFKEQERSLSYKHEQTDYEKFLPSLLALEKGYDASDLDVASGQQFVQTMQNALRKMTEAAHKEGRRAVLEGHHIGKLTQEIPIERFPQLSDKIKEAQEKIKLISQHVAEASKIFKVVKKLKDERFLPLYNTQGPEEAAK